MSVTSVMLLSFLTLQHTLCDSWVPAGDEVLYCKVLFYGPNYPGTVGTLNLEPEPTGMV